jgi:hypothetical protein
MPTPVVTWTEQDGVTLFNSWVIGTVDAGTVSADKTVLIWNNYKGSTALSDMTNCTITTKDSGGGNTGEPVTNTWIESKCAAAGDTTFNPIGGATNRAIKALGTVATAGVIMGTANTGDLTNNKDNYAQVVLHANVPTTASAGNFSFLTRVAYQFV